MFDIGLYSHISLFNIKIPINVHVSKIKGNSNYAIPKYDNVIKYNSVENLEDCTSASFFYGKFKEKLQVRDIVYVLHEFIDYDNLKFTNYLSILPRDKNTLLEQILDSDIDMIDLKRAYDELMYIIIAVKNKFMDEVIGYIDIFKEYPEIPKEEGKDPSKTKIYLNNKEHMQLHPNMITLQSMTEYTGNVLFEENIGKAASEYSWREIELRKLYTKKKTDYDNFSETIQSKIMDEMSSVSKK